MIGAQRFLFLLISTSLAFACTKSSSISGGDGVGNGGDGIAMDFRKTAEAAITLAQANGPLSNDYDGWRARLAAATISSTDTQIFIDGVEKDAINNRERSSIVVNRQRYSQYKDELLKAVLALHEVLGLAGVSDSQFEKSSLLIGYDPIEMRPILRKVDILFVVDDSGSMDVHQAAVLANIEFYFQKIRTARLNYHIGVTTTSSSTYFPPTSPTTRCPAPRGWDDRCAQSDGRLVGGFVTLKTPNPLATLKANLNVGTMGNSEETPFIEIQQALSIPYPENVGFYRPGAALEIIIITDAPEQSATDTDSFLRFIRSLKPSTSQIGVSMFLPLPGDTSCQVDAEIDYVRYYDFLTPLHGSIYNLCQRALDGSMQSAAVSLSSRLAM